MAHLDVPIRNVEEGRTSWVKRSTEEKTANQTLQKRRGSGKIGGGFVELQSFSVALFLVHLKNTEN